MSLVQQVEEKQRLTTKPVFRKKQLFKWLLLLLMVNLQVQADQSNTSDKLEVLSLDQIMSAPDWMGNSPQNPFWSNDDASVYYSQKAVGHHHQQHFKLDFKTNLLATIKSPDDWLLEAASHGELNQTKTHLVFTFQGDVYIQDQKNSQIQAITADAQIQSESHFVDPYTISFLVGYQIYFYHIENGLIRQIADFKLEKNPDIEKKQSYLEQSQPRLLKFIKNRQDERIFQKNREKELKQHEYKTWYLGDNKKIKTFRLSPNAEWLILGLVDKDLSGQNEQMAEWVTDDGYTKSRKVRSLVGSSKPMNEVFYLIDLLRAKKTKIDLASLPGINDDPLKKLRKNAARKLGYSFKERQNSRAVSAYSWTQDQGVEWSNNSHKAAILLFSYDNKSRWIVTLDIDKKKLKTAHWLSDDAWVNDWAFNQFGWLPDNNTLYYLSEEDGYSHLYIKTGRRKSTQLTHGQFEVSDLTIGKNGKQIYYRANKKQPGIYEIYRFDLDSRSSQALTDLGGMNDYILSHDNQKLMVTHSSSNHKPELYLKNIADKSKATQLTHSQSQLFSSYPWIQPEIVAIPSSHIKRNIYSRFYQAQKSASSKAQNSSKRPAVIFVHGAGYLQNSHQGWSGYFREYMFHNYLVQKGYVVLDMDYRASKGYGRDWRTAIYRNMGSPELEDLQDGVAWLVKNQQVDGKRIGVYGGSYGGFMTFMAMFKAPELFAAGAALRPVTDWSHYNHGYTSNILNTPEVDPDAFERSSPIEFAQGLSKPLLICHGMVDDNVFFKDSVRLVQRLIELKKTRYFETAIYPVEAHGFKQPSSWLDEYTRIDHLFDENLW